MKGKICLVTGGTSGVGLAIARGALQRGATVIVPTRDPSRAQDIFRGEMEADQGGRVIPLAADLSSLAQVRGLCEEVRRRFERLDAVSANAAVLLPRREETEEGLEKTFVVNYLSHFLMVAELTGLLEAAGKSRVIVVAGQPGPISRLRPSLEDLQLREGYSPLKATLQAAAAKVLFTLELARRMKGTGVVAHAFHPGLVRSNLGRNLPWYLRPFFVVGNALLSPRCEPGVRLISDEEPLARTGAFYAHGRPVPFRFHRLEDDAGSRLWNTSERLCSR
jgi:NAD(P)-dependent dehydrogenase (short-subunit alcohol dehydrogenase family)